MARRSTGRLKLVGLSVLIAACSSPTTAPRSQLAAPDNGVESVIYWALGPNDRATPPASGGAYLLKMMIKKSVESGSPVTSSCVPMSSFMPAPPSDGRIFSIVRGELCSQRQSGSAPSDPAPLAGAEAYGGLTRLLAFGAEETPLTILAEAQLPNKEEEELWLLRVSDNKLLEVKPMTRHAALQSQEAFFQAFYTPRCLAGGTRCLLLNSVGADFYIDIEQVRGGRQTPFKDLGRVDARGVAWAGEGGDAVYLLRGCQPAKAARPSNP